NIPAPLRSALSAGLGIDPETAMRQLLSGELELPETADDVITRGPRALERVALSRSISLGHTLPRSIPELIGPTPGAIESIGKGVGGLFKRATQPFGPDIPDTLEAMAGGGLKNVIKAARLGAEG